MNDANAVPSAEILAGGDIVTLDPDLPVAEAVVIADGAVADVGDRDALQQRYPRAVVTELGDGCLIPSLIDHHLHLTAIGLDELNRREDERLFVPLAGASSAADVIDRVRRRAELVPKGAWILGMGWNQQDWGTTELPDNVALSRAVPDHPVFLVRIDAHSAWVNEAALARAGIDAASPEPKGGRIERHPDGAPRGVLLERAVEGMLGDIPVAAGWELRRAFALAADALAARGVTEVFDAGFMAIPAIVSMAVDFEVALELLTWADADGDGLPVDVNLMIPSPSRLADKILDDPEAYRSLSPRLRVTHIKLYADGAFGSRGAALTHAYADDPGNRGFMRMTDDEIEAQTRRAIEAGFGIATHAIGDDAVHRVLAAYGRVADDHAVDPRRFRIEHFGYSSLEDQRTAAERGFLLVAQPNFIDPDDAGRTMEDWRLGAGNCDRVYPWRALTEAGAAVTMSSDYYVAPGPALLDFYAAHTRANRAGLPEGGWQPQERLDRETALRMATSLFRGAGGAAIGGAIRAGAPADLAVLSANPLTVPENEILEIRALRTIRRGVTTHRA